MLELPSIRASAALAAYAESLVDGRRVIVFGDASSSLADLLLERGARVIQIYDADPARAAEAAARNTSRSLSYAPLPEGSLSVRDGAFDLALVENLSRFEEPAGLLRRVKRTLTRRGVALVSSPNPEVKHRLLPDPATAHELEYYALYDLLSDEFEEVRMLGQTPFVGYAVAAFAPEGDPAPTIDAGFVPGGAEEPEWFVALASQQPQRMEEYTVVQLPVKWTLPAEAPGRPRALQPRSLARQRDGRDQREGDAATGSALAQLVELREQLANREAWIAELEARATAADARADEVQTEAEDAKSLAQSAAAAERKASERAAKLQEKLDATQEQMAQLRTEAKALRAEKKSLEQEAQAARDELEQRTAHEAEVQAAEQARVRRMAELEGIEEQASRDLATLEDQLQQRAEEIRRLERELREAERISHELVRELEDRPARAQADPDLASRLDGLAAINAEREGDLAAARYRVRQLEVELEEARDASSRLAELEAALDEARSQVQRQATLLAQHRSGVGPEGSSPGSLESQ